MSTQQGNATDRTQQGNATNTQQGNATKPAPPLPPNNMPQLSQKIRPRSTPQPLPHPSHVVLNSLGGDEQPIPNLLVSHPLQHQLSNLPLPITQLPSILNHNSRFTLSTNTPSRYRPPLQQPSTVQQPNHRL